MSVTADTAQRIAANACAALQDIRDGNDFPSHLFEQIERDCRELRHGRPRPETVEAARSR